MKKSDGLAKLGGSILMGIIAVALVMVVWYKIPALLTGTLDFNLWALRMVCDLLPRHFGEMTQAALRVGLDFDKVMLFGEASLVVRGVFFGIKRLRLPIPKDTRTINW